MRSNLQKRGKSTLEAVEVVNISSFGFWLSMDEEEFFLSFKDFPWFRKATIDQICNVRHEHNNQFHWPDLDVDLDLERVKHPERFPLVSKKP